MSTQEVPAPLTPADCDLRDFQFMPVDVHRLLTSETWILGAGDERAAAMTLWLASWHQVPAGSIPKDDRMLAHLSQSGPKWKKLKPHTLRGWIEASDGRLYHPVVAEKALEAWVEKLAFSLSGSAGNAKRWGVSIETDSIRERALAAIGMLRAIAPQSKTLKKKAVAVIESASRGDSGGDEKGSGGDSPEPSGGDSGATRPAIARDTLERDTLDIKPSAHVSSAQPELGDASIERDHPSQRPQRERNVQISLLLNAQSVPATAMHPTVAVTWAQNPSVTDAILNAAIVKAKATLGKQGRANDISIAYLEPIVVQLLAAPPQQQRPAYQSANDKAREWAAPLTGRNRHERNDQPDIIDINPAPGKLG